MANKLLHHIAKWSNWFETTINEVKKNTEAHQVLNTAQEHKQVRGQVADSHIYSYPYSGPPVYLLVKIQTLSNKSCIQMLIVSSLETLAS